MSRTLAVVAVFALVGVVAYQMLTGGASEPPDAVVAAIEDGAPVVDVRTAEEYASGHVAGAIHANVFDDGFERRMAALDRSEPVYLYCATGARSGRAARILEDMGFERVVNAGGLGELAEAGATVER